MPRAFRPPFQFRKNRSQVLGRALPACRRTGLDPLPTKSTEFHCVVPFSLLREPRSVRLLAVDELLRQVRPFKSYLVAQATVRLTETVSPFCSIARVELLRVRSVQVLLGLRVTDLLSRRELLSFRLSVRCLPFSFPSCGRQDPLGGGAWTRRA